MMNNIPFAIHKFVMQLTDLLKQEIHEIIIISYDCNKASNFLN